MVENFRFQKCSFVPEKSPVDPKMIVRGMGWTWVAGFTWDFSEATSNSRKTGKFNDRFIVSYPKNSVLTFSVEPFWRDEQKIVFRDKNRGRLPVNFFDFWQWQELSLIIIILTEKFYSKTIREQTFPWLGFKVVRMLGERLVIWFIWPIISLEALQRVQLRLEFWRKTGNLNCNFFLACLWKQSRFSFNNQFLKSGC